jgi:hypothetical protein
MWRKLDEAKIMEDNLRFVHVQHFSFVMTRSLGKIWIRGYGIIACGKRGAIGLSNSTPNFCVQHCACVCMSVLH